MLTWWADKLIKGGNLANDFEDLKIYQKARELRKIIFEITEKLPKDQDFVLKSQLRRASYSVCANIAEGMGIYHYAEKIQHLSRARGSCEEVKDGSNALLDFGYIKNAESDRFKKEYSGLIRGINKFISYIRKKKST